LKITGQLQFSMALNVIHDDLVHTFGKDAVAYSTVTKYACSAQFSGRQEATPPETPNVERSLVDEAILTALAEFPFPFPFPFPFRFRLCVSSRGGFVFRDPPCTCTGTGTGTGTGTSRNHFASR
jgi:hypothetical protein